MADPAVGRNFQAAEIADEFAVLSYFIAGEEALAKAAEGAATNTDDLCPVQFSPGVVLRLGYLPLHHQLTSMKENPLPYLLNLGVDPAAAARCADKIGRNHQASIALRQGYAKKAEGGPALAEANALFRKVRKLSPGDRDAAVLLGFVDPRLRTKEEAG